MVRKSQEKKRHKSGKNGNFEKSQENSAIKKKIRKG